MSLHELPWLFVDFRSFHISIISPCRTSQHSRGSMNIHKKAAPNSSNPSWHNLQQLFLKSFWNLPGIWVGPKCFKIWRPWRCTCIIYIYIYDYIEVEDETAKWLPKKTWTQGVVLDLFECIIYIKTLLPRKWFKMDVRMVFSITCSILRVHSAEQKSIKQIRGPCGLGQFPPLGKIHPWVFEASQHKDIKRYISMACWSTLGSSGFGGERGGAHADMAIANVVEPFQWHLSHPSEDGGLAW